MNIIFGLLKGYNFPSVIMMWTKVGTTEGKHGIRFRGKKDILTKVTKDSIQYW